MSWITIPIDSIKQFLAENKQSIPSTDLTAYKSAWSLISSNNYQSLPIPIADWILAYNFSSTNTPLQSYTISYINNSPLTELKPLSTQLGLETVDKDRLKRILHYLSSLID